MNRDPNYFFQNVRQTQPPAGVAGLSVHQPSFALFSRYHEGDRSREKNGLAAPGSQTGQLRLKCMNVAAENKRVTLCEYNTSHRI